VKENLRKMRWHRDRMASIPSDGPHDNSAAYSSSTSKNHQSRDRFIVGRIADELLRYVWEGSDHSVTKVSGSRKLDEAGSQTNPRMIITALQHQQRRAEVNTFN
jgi:hypothetical protein